MRWLRRLAVLAILALLVGSFVSAVVNVEGDVEEQEQDDEDMVALAAMVAACESPGAAGSQLADNALCDAGVASGSGDFGTIPNDAGIPYADVFNSTAALGIDPRFVAAIAWQESIHFNEAVIHCKLHSPAGAKGIMQFMPATAGSRGIDPCDPLQAIPEGARFLKENYDRFGSWELAAAGYNAGPEAVEMYGGIPPYHETQKYVPAVMAKWEEYKALYPSGEISEGGFVNGSWAFPLDRYWYETNPGWFTEPHHTNPSIDVPVPTGTPLYAVADGTVTHTGGNCGLGLVLDAGEGVQFVYCHGSELTVKAGARVSAGDQIMISGNTGNSTGPHLHFDIQVNGVHHCPQTWLVAIAEGRDVPPPRSLPTSGCVA